MYIQVRLYVNQDFDLLTYNELSYIKLDDVIYSSVCAYVRGLKFQLPQISEVNVDKITNQRICVTFNEKKDADVVAATPTPTASSSSSSSSAGKKADYTPTEKFDFTCTSSITVYGKMEGSGTYRADVVDSDGKIVANVFHESTPFDTTKTVDLPAGSYSLWILLDNAGNWDLNYTVS